MRAGAELYRSGSGYEILLWGRTAIALHESHDLHEFSGRVADSGEGRWTAIAAIDEGVPAPTLTTALQSRFASRRRDDFANKALSARRKQFGGHAEGAATSARALRVAACRGVPGVRQLDELCVGHGVQEVPDAFGADHVGQLAADQQHRDLQVGRGMLEILGAQSGVIAWLGHEGRIPVPVPAAVAQPQVLLQPLRTSRPGPVWQIGGDGVCGLVESGEPVQAAEHEVTEAGAPFLREPRDDADKDQPGDPPRPGPVGDEDAGQAAHAGPDQYHRSADSVEDLHDVGSQRLDVIVGVRRPIAVAVTATVQRDHVEAAVSPDLAGVLPGGPVLATTVQHEDARPRT